VFVNLVDQNDPKKKKMKDEHRLGTRFKEAVDKLEKQRILHYKWFDFHSECKKMKYGNLAKLVSASCRRPQDPPCFLPVINDRMHDTIPTAVEPPPFFGMSPSPPHPLNPFPR
jgi:hypothetical protein